MNLASYRNKSFQSFFKHRLLEVYETESDLIDTKRNWDE